MTTNTEAKTFIVMEAGFKIIPGKEAGFTELQNKMVPVSMEQPGFISVYGGPILHSSWLYFGVRFDSVKQMDDWHHNAQHQAVQKAAYAKWWTGVYIRKWRAPEAGEALGDRIMCETRLTMKQALTDAQQAVVDGVLSTLGAAGAKRFETLNDEYEAQPYQFVGPLEIAPRSESVIYSLITHWSSEGELKAWQGSEAYRQLSSIGSVVSEGFIAVKEAGHRERLREDKLQRQWTLEEPK